MLRFNLRIIKNAASNVVRGGSTAAVSLALPHFLTQALDVDRFAAWSLMLQIAAYASFVDFGLQMAITRFVAQTTELGLVARRQKVIETSITLLLIASVIALVLIGAVLGNAASIFHGVPGWIFREFQLAGLILGLGTTSQLVFSAFTGILAGLHRNELAAASIASSRISGAILVISASHFTHSLIILASAYTFAGVIGGLVQWAAAIRLLPEIRHFSIALDREVVQALYRFCMGLTAWMLSMFMISGLDVTIVGHFRFSQVGYYSIAATAAAMLAGLNSAVLGALLAPLSAFHARDQNYQIARITLMVSWGNSIVNGTICLLYVLVGRRVLQLWVGTAYAGQTLSILGVLLLAQTLRLAGAPFSVMLISCGVHAKGVVSGLAEGVVNLGLSCYLVRTRGAIGVAYGTLIGAAVSLLVHYFYTLRKSHCIPLRRWELLISAAGLPLLTLLPIGVFIMLVMRGELPLNGWGIVASVLSTVGLMTYTWRLQRSMEVWLPNATTPLG